MIAAVESACNIMFGIKPDLCHQRNRNRRIPGLQAEATVAYIRQLIYKMTFASLPGSPGSWRVKFPFTVARLKFAFLVSHFRGAAGEWTLELVSKLNMLAKSVPSGS